MAQQVVTPSAGPFESLGALVLERIRIMGHFVLFLCTGFIHIFTFPFQFKKILQQIYFIGAKSIPIICLTGLFVGMVLGLQGYYTLAMFGAKGYLGSAVGLSLVRELGPVLTALMVTARAGSAMTAEIGILRISEQIDALKTMNIRPIRYIFSPRLAAAIISIPLLTSIFNVVGIAGGYIAGSEILGVDSAIYFARVESSAKFIDVMGSFIKSFVFAVIVVTIACYQGYYTHRRKGVFGSKSVAISTTSSVVQSSVLILVADYLITSFLL